MQFRGPLGHRLCYDTARRFSDSGASPGRGGGCREPPVLLCFSGKVSDCCCLVSVANVPPGMGTEELEPQWWDGAVCPQSTTVALPYPRPPALWWLHTKKGKGINWRDSLVGARDLKHQDPVSLAQMRTKVPFLEDHLISVACVYLH